MTPERARSGACWSVKMRNSLETKRRGLIKAFDDRKPIILEDLQEDFGGVVQDLRLCGSVLNPGLFHQGSDVDVAVIVAEDKPKWMVKLHKAILGGWYPLFIRHRGRRVPLDPITLCEGEWPAWCRGMTKAERGLA